MSEEKKVEIRNDKGLWVALTVAGLALWKAIDIVCFLISGVLTWTIPQ